MTVLSVGSQRTQRGWKHVFGIPIVLGVLSTVGLISALLGDGVWDALSWIALGVPCAVILWYWFGVRRRGKAVS